ncbi:hypothetical protein VPHK436_0017 [Vibrio phage K436]
MLSAKPRLLKRGGTWKVYHLQDIWGGMTTIWLNVNIESGSATPAEAWAQYITSTKGETNV